VDITNFGERILADDDSRMVREHMDRYRFALRFVEPTSQVLDCACGTGYGSVLLGQRSEDVVAVDLSKEAIQFCRARYAASGVRFEMGNAEELKFESDSFDLYVCFETIEHVPNPEKLLAEAVRVLKPGGRLLVSTPNRVFSGLGPGEKPSNPFHLQEWSLKEFHTMLSRHFGRVSHYVQRVKSPNKFHPKYVLSKGKRMMGLPDVLSVKSDEKNFKSLEDGNPWNPMILISECRKSSLGAKQ